MLDAGGIRVDWINMYVRMVERHVDVMLTVNVGVAGPDCSHTLSSFAGWGDGPGRPGSAAPDRTGAGCQPA
jgi:hypothetical protein